MLDYTELIQQAQEARKISYSPYSRYCVGAALITKDGRIYKGCNIENIAFSPTNCAERTAFFKAISDGERHFKAIAIVGGKQDAKGEELDMCTPCGVCLQVMAEFCDFSTFEVVVAKNSKEYNVYKLKELLPLSFASDIL